jgi:hypothetical protein
MNRIALPFFLAFLVIPGWAKKRDTVTPCQTKFTVIQEDTLKNITQGLTKKQLEWFDNKTQKKYPDVCYVPPAPNVPLVFFIIVTPDVYHGTRVETDRETHDSPVTGTVTNPDGSTSDIDGTVKTTTTSSTAVPYTVHYGIYTLTVETGEGPDKWKVRHRFQQRGLYNTLAGIPLGGKGHHPSRTVIEAAMKWIHEGGLNNPLETVAPQ